MMDDQPYFLAEAGHYVPQPPCAGPWDPASLNGRVVTALCAFGIEQSHPLQAYTPARLTVDMYRLPGFTPLEVRTRLVRDGKRIKVIDAELTSEGVSYARATSQWLLRGDNPAGPVWRPEDWDVPPPEEFEPEVSPRSGSMTLARVAGGFGTLGEKRVWIRDLRPLVGGTPLTPFMWAAMPADMANPLSNAGEGGLAFINSDVTLYLHRVPVDPWVGIDVVDHQASDGIAHGRVRLYDRKGPIGSSSVCGPAQRYLAGGRPAK